MSFWKPFITGAVVSASAILLLQSSLRSPRKSDRTPKSTCNNEDDHARNHNLANYLTPTNNQTPTPAATDTSPSILLDSPHLDMRMIRKAEGAIQKRTSRITVVVERCTNDYNYSAILRTTEALGVQNVWIICPPVVREPHDGEMLISMKGTQIHANAHEVEARKLHHLYAQRATEWLTVREFASTRECLDELRMTGHAIWVTDVSQEAICLDQSVTRDHIPPKLAICFGTEAVGCTPELLAAADRRVYLPLRGIADSLNLSVATALVVHHLFMLDPTIEGTMSEAERRELRRQWFPKLASQRLLSATKKKERGRLLAKLSKYMDLERKQFSGVKMQADQLDKIAKLPAMQRQLQEWDATLQKLAEESVADLVDHPPAPITDMRRADEHRTCYVGKKTISRNGWTDMPATTGYDTKAGVSMADFFRGRITKVDNSNESRS